MLSSFVHFTSYVNSNSVTLELQKLCLWQHGKFFAILKLLELIWRKIWGEKNSNITSCFQEPSYFGNDCPLDEDTYECVLSFFPHIKTTVPMLLWINMSVNWAGMWFHLSPMESSMNHSTYIFLHWPWTLKWNVE